jgi:hypothetical protein
MRWSNKQSVAALGPLEDMPVGASDRPLSGLDRTWQTPTVISGSQTLGRSRESAKIVLIFPDLSCPKEGGHGEA